MLSYLPFDVLLTSLPKSSNDFATLPYLLKNFTVRNLFSATLIQPRKVNRDFAFAYLGFAPSYAHSQQFASGLPNGSVSNPGILTHNVQEVTEAFSYFKGKIFLQEEATEKTFREVAGSGRLLHLSMHAFTDDQEPSFSGLIFTPADSSEGNSNDDGILHLHELYNVSLNADLAVLSACETGSGHYARGEGIMSFGRAFRYAGSENIVMSLWKANDQATSQIMEMFFYNLNTGMTKDEALRQAKLTFISTSRNKFFAHPYYWSAFVFMGNPAPLISSSLSIWSYLALILAFLMIALFTSIAIMRRAKITSK
jgi:CHAT domain-containing protein